ncbi:hypothetical protein [Rhodohalobacter sp. 614A]|uniref:hypothetical protein n=1 Tax=Rhodohalobacter sp. 614A TaxID=2908649 RepID=UPI001F1EAAA0|nr:hypothetical protein [Rhodohalobacter sp. 614A]
MIKIFIAALTFWAISGIYPDSYLQAQNEGTETEIIFTEQKKEEAREQLRRILSRYKLDPWIFTNEIQIESGVDPHSHPILTLNTEYLDNDEAQLSVFLHEQAHWFVYQQSDKTEQAIEELKAAFPDAPASADFGTFRHLIVGWLELDGMTELTSEDLGRELIRMKMEKLISEPYSDAELSYKWYNDQVLTKTDQIGAILSSFDLIITPGKGLNVSSAN